MLSILPKFPKPFPNADIAACVLVSVLVLAFSLLGFALISFSFGMPLF